MNRIFLGIVSATVLGTLAIAATFEEMDADTDGLITFEEVTAMYPDVTEDAFTIADTNTDGMLDAEELAAAQEAGVLPSAS